MTIQNFMAEQIERIGLAFADFIGTTNLAMLDWQPSMPGSASTRSILEQAGECIAVNRYFAAMLRGETVDAPAGGMKVVAPSTGEDGKSNLISSSADLAEAVRTMNDGDLDKKFDHWRGPVSGSKLIIGAYRNMAYHTGQVNLIQMLAGDSEFHMPPTWY